MALVVTLTHEASAIEALRDEWIALQHRSAARGAALSWHWLSVWWRHFNRLGELWLLEAREEGRLLGIGPLMKIRQRPKYGYSWRQLEFIGTSHRHEHLDFIVETGNEAHVVSAFVETLMQQARHWDVLLLAGLSETPTIQILKTTRPGWRENLEREMITPFLELPRDVHAWMHAVSKNRRKKQRSYGRRLDEDFPERWSIEMVHDPAMLDKVLDRLIELHQAKWGGRKGQGAFHLYGDLTGYYRELMHGLLRQGWLRLRYMMIDGRMVVVTFGYDFRGRAYDQVSGVDNTVTDVPLGHVMTQHCIEQAIANGNDEYSFMLGEEAYKYSFGAANRTQHALELIINRRVRFQRKAVNVLRGIKAWMRKVACRQQADRR